MFWFLFFFCSFALWFLFACQGFVFECISSVCTDQDHRLNRISGDPFSCSSLLTCLSKTFLKGDVWPLVVVLLFYEMDLAGKTKIFKGPVKAALSLGKRVTRLALFFLRFLSAQWLPFQASYDWRLWECLPRNHTLCLSDLL